MTILLILFLGSSIVLWISIFGYILVLGLLALKRRHPAPEIKDWPPVAVVIPALNEENLILAKLQDLKLSDYPGDRTTIIVVDGGSYDQTTALVEKEISRGESLHLECLDESAGKADQVNYALKQLTQDIIVFTDVDSELDPSCIKELVRVLVEDPQTAVVGATVRPASCLQEELIHWRLLNFLWWLEGEALFASGLSGVCYAVRRKVVLPVPRGVRADDISLAISASRGSYGARLSRKARATEVRVPQTTAELLNYRRRRGAAYRAALLSTPEQSSLSAGARLARRLHLWYFRGAPQLSLGLLTAGCVLLATSSWPQALVTLLAFIIPSAAVVLISASQSGESHPWWKRSLAAGRFLALTFFSLLTLNKDSLQRAPTRALSPQLKSPS
jgi:cellulose synthase/poly-beta-1,6-N-acetylglucosamine synthase-like glycosyltransferase